MNALMPNLNKYFKILLFITVIIPLQSVDAKMNSDIEKSYLGGYTKSEFETISQLVLLDDHTFFFTFMGGSLDLSAVGYWKLNSNPESGIELNEVRLQTQVFPAYIEKTKNEENKVRFIFDGYSMSNAEQAVFAISKTDQLPAHFKPLFEEGQSHWRDEYELPEYDADEVQYFYLGYVQVDQFDQPEKLKVFQFKRENAQQIKIGFNSPAVNPLLKMSAVLENNTLKVDGNTFGTKDEIPLEIIKEIRENFIDPVLKQENSNHESEGQINEVNQISSIKELSLELNAISGKPYKYITPDPFAFKYTDWLYLDVEYNDALEDSNLVPDFLKVSSGLVEHQTVEKDNADNLVGFYNNLLNNNVENTSHQFEIIDTFINKIEPAIKSFRKDEIFNKNFEIFVSNSLGITIAHKNESLKLKIYKMLGDHFDLKELKHGTLLYNLACDYSLNKDKQKMLQAIELAIEKGKNPVNFTKDSDFKFYYTDPDFIRITSGE